MRVTVSTSHMGSSAYRLASHRMFCVYKTLTYTQKLLAIHRYVGQSNICWLSSVQHRGYTHERVTLGCMYKGSSMASGALNAQCRPGNKRSTCPTFPLSAILATTLWYNPYRCCTYSSILWFVLRFGWDFLLGGYGLAEGSKRVAEEVFLHLKLASYRYGWPWAGIRLRDF